MRLIFLSRIEEKKGLDILFDAVCGLAVPYKLTVAGDGEPGYVDELKRKAVSLGIADRIEWLGFVREEKFKLLASQELLVLPSHDENFGNVVVESLSVGTAVLVSDKVGLAGYVEQQQLGWICPNTAEAIKATLTGIYQNRQTLVRIRTAAPARIRMDYDEQALTAHYTRMYQNIIHESI
jgi:glycosyltransferase involved in cell wall biosynthesis